MPSFKEMVEKYKKRRHDTVVDAVTTGLSLADNVTVDLGLLEDTGVATEIAETVSNVLPFAVIAVTEQCKVLLGKKTGAAGRGTPATAWSRPARPWAWARRLRLPGRVLWWRCLRRSAHG